MQTKLLKTLKDIAEERQGKTDPAHDFQHIIRVLNMAIKIGKSVKADLDIIIPAVLFHDIVMYPKDSPQNKNASNESAEVAEQILNSISKYPKAKIENVKTCITECSFTKGIKPNLLESKVLQDADLLESTGAISIMRTFASGGQMNRSFYNPKKPFYEKGEKDYPSGVGLFYRRLLIAEKRMHTAYAKKTAKRRTEFLKKFLAEFKKELQETDII